MYLTFRTFAPPDAALDGLSSSVGLVELTCPRLAPNGFLFLLFLQSPFVHLFQFPKLFHSSSSTFASLVDIPM